MKTTAIALSRQRLTSRPNLAARLPDFIALTKPRVMALAVFTALVGFMMAPSRLDPLRASVAILAIAAGAGAAGVLNMWYDADIDAVMTRTAGRPIPRGAVTRLEALTFGLVLACSAFALLAFAANITAATLLAFTIFFYVVVYTMWLKRRTPQNIVIGGAAGALPPVIGWAAASGEFAFEPLVLFLIVVLWTPPLLGAVAHSRRRICLCWRAHAAGCCRQSRDHAPNPDLQHSAVSDFTAAVGARLCRRNLRRRCSRLWSDLCCARGATAQKPWCHSPRSVPPIRVFHFVSDAAFCCAACWQR
jgi:UbiA prenyltransferase family